ncbi:ATPase component of ABC transporters with duplicated ATPase domain [Brachybacterium faecium DSM 4810]|uniref:ATPase component of ABC transporters with duplicated ATPase domain n=1 Tax=Brachybacterium faecium (strain ATCC 43885 / DSM 4810 / JCM 11609 / LMG 19847 / NBRC 14762 / NCIMB 9860 / 6-10) TaxID=446465 RepID=C7MC69_BRAFD|nr:ABC-F family ATP-binding cassette domain-containing protein [Brachybacterium faecium]ACU85176.1 ATPase component of ABC transporters with duplicated ATPase domain [Brachybacterium faecium DSM 4810]HJG51034.1 ABC-F family ATP-binding cassette domain-containing protein [Brachybacterium faecium]
MAHLLGTQSLHVALPDRVLLDDITVGIDEGDRIGVVGRNGDGKSTLLRLLARTQEPDDGRVTVRGGVRVGVLSQQDEATADTTVRHRVVGDRPEFEWASDPRIRDVLAGLLGGIDLEAPLTGLSGGQLRRVHLAELLVGEWDVLLLDEPTNHLDVEGIAWLAEHLRRRWNPKDGGLVVITHDRWFLDAVCTRMWEVHDGLVEPFEGGYAAYVLQRVERDRQAAAIESKRQNLMRKELAWLRRGAPARTSKPKFRIDAANELIAGEPPVRDSVALTQLATSRLGRDVIDVLDVDAGYGDGTVLHDVTLHVGPADRIGVLGPNGAGKSTLLGLITGDVPPQAGRVKKGKTVTVRQVTQRLEGLQEHLDSRVSDVVGRYRTTFRAGKDEVTPGQLLERLGFTAAHLKVKVGALSGGQQRRLDLLLTLLDEPNVLVLDEPTNDMDTDMLAAMEDLLDTWPGPLLVVSHDRYLLERVTDIQYAVLDGTVQHVPGGVEQYLQLRAASEAAGGARAGGGARATGGGSAPGAAATAAPARGAAPSSGGAGSSSGGGTSAAVAPALSGAEAHAAQKELGAVERRMQKLERQTATLHSTLAEHDQSDYVGLAEITAQLREVETEIEGLEERWLELSELLG